jgi:hypothetical protein
VNSTLTSGDLASALRLAASASASIALSWARSWACVSLVVEEAGVAVAGAAVAVTVAEAGAAVGAVEGAAEAGAGAATAALELAAAGAGLATAAASELGAGATLIAPATKPIASSASQRQQDELSQHRSRHHSRLHLCLETKPSCRCRSMPGSFQHLNPFTTALNEVVRLSGVTPSYDAYNPTPSKHAQPLGLPSQALLEEVLADLGEQNHIVQALRTNLSTCHLWTFVAVHMCCAVVLRCAALFTCLLCVVCVCVCVRAVGACFALYRHTKQSFTQPLSASSSTTTLPASITPPPPEDAGAALRLALLHLLHSLVGLMEGRVQLWQLGVEELVVAVLADTSAAVRFAACEWMTKVAAYPDARAHVTHSMFGG